MPRPPDPKLLGHLAASDPAVVELALALRDLVLEEAPDAVEKSFAAYAVVIWFSSTGKMKDQFCHIAAYTRHVNLGFNRGAAMPDPYRLLEGTGKQIRHIRFASQRDLERPFLRAYIRAAAISAGDILPPS